MFVRRTQLDGFEASRFELFDHGFDVPVASDVVADKSESHGALPGDILALLRVEASSFPAASRPLSRNDSLAMTSCPNLIRACILRGVP